MPWQLDMVLDTPENDALWNLPQPCYWYLVLCRELLRALVGHRVHLWLVGHRVHLWLVGHRVHLWLVGHRVHLWLVGHRVHLCLEYCVSPRTAYIIDMAHLVPSTVPTSSAVTNESQVHLTIYCST
jgi:hypothetical protein